MYVGISHIAVQNIVYIILRILNLLCIEPTPATYLL